MRRLLLIWSLSASSISELEPPPCRRSSSPPADVRRRRLLDARAAGEVEGLRQVAEPRRLAE